MLRMKPMEDDVENFFKGTDKDVENFFKGTDKEFEVLENIIKHTLVIISEHEKLIESSDLK